MKVPRRRTELHSLCCGRPTPRHPLQPVPSAIISSFRLQLANNEPTVI
jgi:hypothetical protein